MEAFPKEGQLVIVMRRIAARVVDCVLHARHCTEALTKLGSDRVGA